MRRFCKTIAQREVEIKPWHPWFAWHPVFISNVGMVWLETIERSGHATFSMVDGFNGFIYEYRMPESK